MTRLPPFAPLLVAMASLACRSPAASSSAPEAGVDAPPAMESPSAPEASATASASGAPSGLSLGGSHGPPVRVEEVRLVVDGPLDVGEVRRILSINRSRFRLCYTVARRKNPSLGDVDVALRFRVGSLGDVSGMTIVSSTLDDPQFKGCLTGELRGLSFPEPAEKRTAVVSYEVALSPPDASAP